MTEVERLKSDIDKFWQIVASGWQIEDRAYFEREARRNGFDSPLAMAAHHMWKRELKERDPAGAAALEAQAQPAEGRTNREGLDVRGEWAEAVYEARENYTVDPHQHIERLVQAGDSLIDHLSAQLRAALRAPAEAPQGEQVARRISELTTALAACVVVMERHIYPKPDAGPEHPWSVLQAARAALSAAPKGED